MEEMLEIDAANARVHELNAELEKKRAEIEDLRAQLNHLRGQLFGQRREKIDPAQLRLFEASTALLQQMEQDVAGAATKTDEPKREKKKRGHGRAPFAPDLPREVIPVEVPEGHRCCPECGDPMNFMGLEVTERGHMVPAKLVVKRYEREKYGCPQGHRVTTAPLPDGVVDKGKYEASAYAYIAVSKYCDHLPLHRIQGMLTRVGAHLAKQSMWDMMVRLDELVAQPVLAEMQRQLLQETHLQADETPVRVQVEGSRGAKTGTLWAWRNIRGSEVEKILFDFRPDRSARGPDRFLGEWTGTLLTDGYDGVNPTASKNEIVRAGCWAHGRRKFRDALNANATKSAVVLQPIQRLFWIERAIVARAEARKLDREGLLEMRGAVRERISKRVLAKIYERAFVLDEDASLTGDSLLGKAVRYVINQRGPLLAHLSIPAIPIHNNDTERDLRHVVTGRKNWMIFGSPRGGQVAARLFSLVLSAKAAGVNVQDYLEDALARVSSVNAKDIAMLTPWGWGAEREKAARDQAS